MAAAKWAAVGLNICNALEDYRQQLLDSGVVPGEQSYRGGVLDTVEWILAEKLQPPVALTGPIRGYRE